MALVVLQAAAFGVQGDGLCYGDVGLACGRGGGLTLKTGNGVFFRGVREGWKAKNSEILEEGKVKSKDTVRDTNCSIVSSSCVGKRKWSNHWSYTRNFCEDELKRWTKPEKGKVASKREIKNTFMNLANENVSLLLAYLKGHSSVPELGCMLSQLTSC